MKEKNKSQDKIEAKKNPRKESRKMNKNLMLGIAISVLIAVVVLTNGFDLLNSAAPNSVDKESNEDMRILLSEISETAKWYEYETWKVTVKFFAVRAADGSIKTGFDACDFCYKTKKGYRQEGDVMVCNNCGNRYPISGLGTKNRNPGGCWPGYLPNYIDGDYLVINSSDLEKGGRLFA